MQLYSLVEDLVFTTQHLVINGVTSLVDTIAEADLNAAGYYKVTYGNRPDQRYYISTESKALNTTTNVYEVTYTATELPLADVQARMLKSINDTGNKKFDETTAGYTASEMSSWKIMEDEALSHATTPLTSGVLYDESVVSGELIDDLVNSVLANASAFRSAKSYISGMRKKKSLEVQALATVADCIAYEKSPYNYTLTQADIDTGFYPNNVVGAVITRYRNNCTEWV